MREYMDFPINRLRRKLALLAKQLSLEGEEKTLVKSLPLGWKQKLAFSIAIVHDPAIVFLDEPTGGVDPITRREFWSLIYEASAQGNHNFCNHPLYG